MPAASTKRRKWKATNDAKCLPKFGRIVTCCRAEHSAEFFGRTSVFAKFRPISNRQTHRDINRHMETYTDTQRHGDTHKCRQRHTQMQTETEPEKSIHRHWHTHTYQQREWVIERVPWCLSWWVSKWSWLALWTPVWHMRAPSGRVQSALLQCVLHRSLHPQLCGIDCHTQTDIQTTLS